MYFDNKTKQARAWIAKAKQEAQKLAVAVIIAETLLVTGYAIGEQYNLFDIFRQSGTITIVQAKKIAVKEETKADRIGEIADYIWNKESTRGKNNFSKCEAIGKTNGIGFGVPGNGSYMCFENHEDEMQVLRGWIIAKIAQGYTITELLCTYQSGIKTEVCDYARLIKI